MIKSLSALAIVSLLGTAAIALPGFAPKARTGEVAVLAKADRLDVRPDASNCSIQAWPDFAAHCLRNADSGAKVLEVRLVTARR
jgi:hypothetical protein